MDTPLVNSPTPPIAFLQLGPQKVVVGEGPFTSLATPPDDCSAFYWNDFELSDNRPWKVPSRYSFHASFDHLALGAPPQIHWDAVDRSPFDAAFGKLTQAFQNGAKLEKLVPMVTEHGHLQAGDLRQLAPTALERSGDLAQAYGRWDDKAGFIGATPERLLRVAHGVLETMAVAGTAPPSDRERFARDPKQIREHALVIQGIRAAIGGDLEESEREVLELDGLLHFLTRLSAVLPEPVDLNALIQQLHPTPAVGFLPRSEKVSQLNASIREQLAPPANFAAPFGWLHEGDFQAVVAIRHVSWEGEHVALPAGCGLIQESQLDLEWSELALKRSVVKQLLCL